jgi:hypothetical protein
MTRPKIKKILPYGVLAVAVIGAVTYLFLIQREKAQFNQAEKEIDALYAQIIEKVGKPDQEKKEKSCGYASRVYGKGPRSCSVSKYFLYENKDATQSNIITEDVKKLSGNAPLQRFGDKSINKFIEYDKTHKTNDQQLSQGYSDIGNLVCNLRYSYPEIELFSNIFKSKHGTNLQISITCSGPAMAEHYQLID